jgi:hypothetical protein
MPVERVELDPRAREFYARTLAVLNQAGVPYLLGGAYAFALYTGIERHTKDMDIFARRADRDRILAALEAAGYRTEVPFPHWLAKAYSERDFFIDVIYSSGNGESEVDDEWFEHARPGTLLGLPVRRCPPEELIWSKAYVMERERFDGADVIHLVRACGPAMDWDRLLRRFGPHWRVLLAHLVLFGYAYPDAREAVPAWVLHQLIDRLRDEVDQPAATERVCFGTLLSREQYLTDIGRWGYHDGRLEPWGRMTPEEIAHWTAAIAEKG